MVSWIALEDSFHSYTTIDVHMGTTDRHYTITDAHMGNGKSTIPHEQDAQFATVHEASVARHAPRVLLEALVNAQSLPSFSSTSPQRGKTMLDTPPYSDTRIVPLRVSPKAKGHPGLRYTQSSPSLAHQLSDKISNTFNHQTVVHRPSLKARPSLACLQTLPLPLLVPEQKQQADTDLSSKSNSESGSPTETSTAKTSVESNQASVGSTTHRDLTLKDHHQLNRTIIHEESGPRAAFPIEFPPAPLPAVVKPTMLTVELAASTKIFFETHYAFLNSRQITPRSLRRHDLEAYLRAGRFTEEQKQLQRSAWEKQESANLRLSRVQRSKSQQRARGSGIAIAGYEVIRILGKGSFGVVRLVKEQGNGSSDSSTGTSSSHLSFTREDFQNLRTTAMDAVRKTLDGRSSTPPKSPRPRSPRSTRSQSRKVKKEVYAMKVIRKADMLKNSQESHLRAERDFLVASEKSKWVVPLIAAFQDQTNLYLVMDYMIGGDFLGLLIRYDRLKEKATKWYLAEMILCIEEAHRLNWIHRDVKPDNFLISASGHLKISDFGLAFDGHWSHDKSYFNNQRYSLMEKLGIKVEGDAEDRKESSKASLVEKVANAMKPKSTKSKKSLEMRRHQLPSERSGSDKDILQWRDKHGRRKLAESVVGTSQYMAPEVIRGDPYDGRCDWWSIGIILFEV